MTESRPPKATSIQTKILGVFMIVALGICISVLSTLDTSSLLSIDKPVMFLFAVMTQTAVCAVYTLAWQVNLKRCGIENITYHDSILHSGVAFLGKYVPGKIGGLLMRGVTVHKTNPSTRLIVKATTIEQATMVHSGLLVCCFTWSIDADMRTALPILALAFGSLILVLFPKPAIFRLRKLTGRFPRISATLEVFEENFQTTYFTIMLFMLVIWLLSALSLDFVLQSFSVDMRFDEILWITTLSFLSGFFAVFLPAGIGAREGALVLLLSPYCSTLTAVAVATLHRLATISIDLVIGSYALHKLSKS